MNKSTVASLFYLGTLLSSIGSFAFNVALIAFLLKSNFTLAQATLIIGLQRFVPVVVTGIWGHASDKIPAKILVAVAEGIAALTSIGLILVWNGSSTNYSILMVICVVRSVVVSFQTGSRSKITKFLSDDSYSENSKNVIWLNKATQGATLFGGLFSWIIIQYFNFETAILFDAATFLLNGIIAIMIPNFEQPSDLERPVRWNQKFKDFFNFTQKAAILDILLALSMMGTVAYMSRLAGGDQSWTGLYMASYGLAVWVTGFLERGITTRLPTFPYWILLGVSFITLGFFHSPSFLTLLLFFLKDFAFWTIFHRISSHIQVDTPISRLGGVISARASIMITILATGEILVGAWANTVSIADESSYRALLCISVGVFLCVSNFKKAVLHDRPAL